MNEAHRDDDGFVLRSEFAVVRVSVDEEANGVRLRIEDLRTGRVAFFDPLELERLTAATHADLTHIVSPSGAEWWAQLEVP
jgi:hypothetical protein